MLHIEATQIVQRLYATRLILPEYRGHSVSCLILGVLVVVGSIFIPSIPKCALLSVVRKPPFPTKPHPLSLRSPNAEEKHVQAFVTTTKYLQRIMLPLYVDL